MQSDFLKYVARKLSDMIESSEKRNVCLVVSPANFGLKAEEIIEQTDWSVFAANEVLRPSKNTFSRKNNLIDIEIKTYPSEARTFHVNVRRYPNEKGKLLMFSVIW